MVKGKSKKSKVVGKRVESDATSSDITIVGVLFDKATFVLGSVEDPNTPIGDVVPALGLKLQNHVNTTFGTQLTLSPTATIAGLSFALWYSPSSLSFSRNYEFPTHRASCWRPEAPTARNYAHSSICANIQGSAALDQSRQGNGGWQTGAEDYEYVYISYFLLPQQAHVLFQLQIPLRVHETSRFWTS